MRCIPTDAKGITLGVDTHKDTHVAVALDGLGRRLGTLIIPTTRSGYEELAEWANGFGSPEGVGIEGTGSFGAGLSRFLRSEGIRVFEVDRPKRRDQNRCGKSDPIDAELAAQQEEVVEAFLAAARDGRFRERGEGTPAIGTRGKPRSSEVVLGVGTNREPELGGAAGARGAGAPDPRGARALAWSATGYDPRRRLGRCTVSGATEALRVLAQAEPAAATALRAGRFGRGWVVEGDESLQGTRPGPRRARTPSSRRSSPTPRLPRSTRGATAGTLAGPLGSPEGSSPRRTPRSSRDPPP